MSESVSIIIPARNEEVYLGTCLESIGVSAAKAGVSPEVIVVLNRCTDGTEAIARAAGARVVGSDAKNLSAIRNAGARVASGDVLLTIDADSRMSENMIGSILQHLATGKVIGGGVRVQWARMSPGIFMTTFLLVPILLRYRISGGLFWCRREDFEAIGGFDEAKVSVEDLDFARRLKAHGKREGKRFKTLLRERIITSTRKFDRFGDWYFVLRPFYCARLLRGRDQKAADQVWYDFEH